MRFVAEDFYPAAWGGAFSREEQVSGAQDGGKEIGGGRKQKLSTE
jgi:hypothetical protein